MIYLWQFGGLSTLHNVFLAGVPADAVAQPGNEIAQCRWFVPSKIATLSSSVPTRGIVELLLPHGRLQVASLSDPTGTPAGEGITSTAKQEIRIASRRHRAFAGGTA